MQNKMQILAEEERLLSTAGLFTFTLDSERQPEPLHTDLQTSVQPCDS